MSCQKNSRSSETNNFCVILYQLFICKSSFRKKAASILFIAIFLYFISTLINPVIAGDNSYQLLLTSPSGDVGSFAMSDDGMYTVVGTYNQIFTDRQMVYLLSKNGTILWSYNTKIQKTPVAISADGNNIVAGGLGRVYSFSNSGTVLWDNLIKNVTTSIAITPNGQSIVAVSDTGYIFYFSKDGSIRWINSINNRTALAFAGIFAFTGESGINNLGISSDGQYVVLTARDTTLDTSVIYYFSGSGKLLWSYNLDSRMSCVSMSRDGQFIAAGPQIPTGVNKGKLYLFSNDGKPLWTNLIGTNVDGSAILSVAITPDGKYVVAGSDSTKYEDNTINVFSHEGNLLWANLTSSAVTSVAISSTGQEIVAGTRNEVILFSNTGQQIWSIKKEGLGLGVSLSNIQITPDGQYIGAQFGDDLFIYQKNIPISSGENQNLNISFLSWSIVLLIGMGAIVYILDRYSRKSKSKSWNTLMKPPPLQEIRIEPKPQSSKQKIQIEPKPQLSKQKIQIASKSPILNEIPQELANRYTEFKQIGKGGFASVFRAKRTDGKYVAVKIPLSIDAETGRSFIAEIQNWTKLNHPNIVRVFDYNIMPFPYFEMELCDGSLADMKKPIDREEAAWIIFNICEGLKYTHKRLIVHRDLKPQNILLKEGMPKISDWGLSRVITESTSTTTGSFTPFYAAPEQVNNKPKDERTDIWQLGVILYELTTGMLPFKGDSVVEVAVNISTQDPIPPSKVNPAARQIEPIILMCLQKEPNKRFQSVVALQRAIGIILKTNYSEAFKESKTAKDIRRSAYYAGDLVMVNLIIGDLNAAHKYATDLVEYAKGDTKALAQEFCDQLYIRIENKVTDIPDELIKKAEVVVHKVVLGFRNMK